jgi:hypothetical protein
MINKVSTLADAMMDFIYDENSSNNLADATIYFI